MDKLRALQYFVAAAEERSFSGAARRLELSIPSVLKLVNALERHLGTALFVRSPQGLILTADGASYLDRCQPLLLALDEADELLADGRRGRPRGLVVVGAPGYVARDCLGPELPRFHARFPDIELDFRVVQRLSDAQAEGVDVFLMFGWQESPDLVQRPIGRTRYLVVATPAYWAAHGMPQRPRDLARHPCMLFRSGRTLLDEWGFQRGDETESVSVHGWLASSHRELLLDAVLAGQGVIRATDLTLRAPLALDRLVPALPDWTALQPPPVNLLFRPQQRRSARVRRFMEFAAEVFAALQAERDDAAPTAGAERPPWWDKQRRSSRVPSLRGPGRGAG